MEKPSDHRALTTPSRHNFVKVAPPTVHAGLGNALREAYQMNSETRSLRDFEELISRLDTI